MRRIVVPSIWDENSPSSFMRLSNAARYHSRTRWDGEYVQNGVNGLTFTHRDAEDLRSSMQNALDNPEHLAQLVTRILAFRDGQIPSNKAHAAAILHRYEQLISTKVEVMN